jgi:hypothetical protein
MVIAMSLSVEKATAAVSSIATRVITFEERIPIPSVIFDTTP